jgi:hypothetical protein
MMRGGPPRHVSETLPFGETERAAELIARARLAPGARPPAEMPARSPSSMDAPPPEEPPHATEPKAPLQVFDELAKAFFAETGFWPPNHALAPADDGRAKERSERWATWLRDRRRAPAAPPAPPAPPEEREPAPNSPEDVGFTNFENSKPAAPRHDPKLCSSCNASILWAQLLDENGQRIKHPETGRMKSIPVDFQPDPDGNVVLFHRDGEGIVARVLKKGEAPPAGARLRKSHFATCPNANQHRRSDRRGGRRA